MSLTVLGLFDKIEEPAAMVKPLEDISIHEKDMALLSVAPYPDGTVFYDEDHSPLWAIAIVCGIIGFIAALGLAGWTQWHINLNVGGKPTLSIPPVVIIAYEFTLAGAVLGTFFGMIYYAQLPDWNELAYDQEISRSKIGVLVRCEDETTAVKIEEIMRAHNVVTIKRGRDDF